MCPSTRPLTYLLVWLSGDMQGLPLLAGSCWCLVHRGVLLQLQQPRVERGNRTLHTAGVERYNQRRLRL